jgi:hypothetical protein
MLIRNRGVDPKVDPSAYIAPTAVLVGRVSVGARCRIMYVAVLDSEGSGVEVGPTSIVNEHAVLRATAVGDAEHPVLVGDPLEVFAPGDEGLAEAIKNAGFAASAFGVESPWEDRIARYRAATEVRAEEFGAHLGDVVLGANPER